ncbi:antiviral reverse transcriptase Drt3b [Neptunicella sp.]|uniref:antiviral reverse transcriptase Drt3b n=1 Tax=Neptunicella sp. TaxID=2125986 RepID=UPI003F691889
MKSIIKKNDFNRVLLSETSPEDVPIIFSNYWFYKHMDQYHKSEISSDFKKKIIECIFISKSEEKDFVPLKYSILKSNGGLRHLGILHPASQNQMVDLYQTFEKRIINHTTNSAFSIRAPYKVSTVCYYNETLAQNLDEKPASTYFAYKSYTRLNKFFESKEFLALERKYSKFWALDISRFFENIYTHSISWAIKGKSFAKETRSNSDFAKFFDQLMQRSNFNETNGIIIGNEVSRVFAEIILQAIDNEICEELKTHGLEPSVDYDIKRYVDDYYIFSSKDGALEKISSVLQSKLRFYKLHINENKTVKSERPFITGVTRAKLQTGESISWLFKTIFERKEDGLVELRKPSQIKRKFIDRVMAASYQDKKAYSVMCGYVISALHNQLIKVTKYDWFMESKFSDIKNSLLTLLDIAFHLFNVSPTSNNSVKLCSMCNILHEFYKDHFPEEVDSIVLEVSSLIKEFFESCVVTQRENNASFFVPIEFANLLCVSSSMGSEYLLSPKVVKEVFGLDGLKHSAAEYIDKEDCFDYFNLVAVLFYIKNHEEYNQIKAGVVKEINKRLKRIERVSFDARICYLLLDSMSCPYIDQKTKKQWGLKLEKVLFDKALNDEDSNELLEQLVTNCWFVCWNDELVLNNLIVKNNLLFGY